MSSKRLSADDLGAFVQRICLEGELVHFEEMVDCGTSTIDWSCSHLGAKVIPTYLNENTDQARRRAPIRMTIANWIDMVAGPLIEHDVLDLFSGCGSVSAELSALGVASYTGVDLNGVLVTTANDVAAPRCKFQCSDVLQFVKRSNLTHFTTVLLLYEALNGLRRSEAAELIGALGQSLSPGAWVFGDIRDLPHMDETAIEITGDCPYMALDHGDVVIREFGYTSNQKHFGSRYIRVPTDGRPLETALSVLTLMDVEALDRMLARAGMTLASCSRLIIDQSTDVPESAQNLFFAARVGRA